MTKTRCKWQKPDAKDKNRFLKSSCIIAKILVFPPIICPGLSQFLIIFCILLYLQTHWKSQRARIIVYEAIYRCHTLSTGDLSQPIVISLRNGTLRKVHHTYIHEERHSTNFSIKKMRRNKKNLRARQNNIVSVIQIERNTRFLSNAW